LAFRRLDQWLIGHGYVPQTLLDVVGSDCKLALNYYNPAWDKKAPTGTGPVRHTGITALYEPKWQHSPVFWLGMPNSQKGCLGQFSFMSEQLQDFIMAHTKECNGCRYCVQVDKSGKRPLACTEVLYNQDKYNLCPLFPGGSYKWQSINNELVDRLIEILTFMDSSLPNKEATS